ncbi:MAG: hypothetical protein K8I27_08615 [Planctomycetes bacterium]|nr:hypothetical protein [Planctomycetota bacterium]
MRRTLVATMLLLLGVFVISAQELPPPPTPPEPPPPPPTQNPTPPPEGDDKPVARLPDSVFETYDTHGVVKPYRTIDYKDLNESSGLEHWQDAWWSHNDAGDGAYLYRSTDLSFNNARRYAVPGAVATDWEDITTLGEDLLVCDIGDNDRRRKDLTLYRVGWNTDDAKLTLKAKYKIAYPDGKHDAEAAAEIDGVLHIISKNRGEGFTGVYRFADLREGERNTGELVCKLDVDERVMITAADFDPVAKKLLLLSYTRVYVYGDKLDGKPERNVLIYAQQCESLCIHDRALVYGNEQGQFFRVNDFLSSKYEFLLPEWAQAELPMQSEDVELDGAGKAWAEGAYEFKLKNMRKGEYLRWKICGAYLMLAGRFEYDSFNSSSERGDRLGTALVVMIGSEWTDFLTGDETHLWLGDNGATGVDAWKLNPDGFKLTPIPGLKAGGQVEGRSWAFEYAVPLTAVFGEGKLPDEFLVNVWGYNLHGEDEPHLRGDNLLTLGNPYIWGGATLKPAENKEGETNDNPEKD